MTRQKPERPAYPTLVTLLLIPYFFNRLNMILKTLHRQAHPLASPAQQLELLHDSNVLRLRQIRRSSSAEWRCHG